MGLRQYTAKNLPYGKKITVQVTSTLNGHNWSFITATENSAFWNYQASMLMSTVNI